MRQRALVIAQIDPGAAGMDYYYLADNNSGGWADGEVQIFGDFNERRAAAAEARRQVLQDAPTFADPDSLHSAVAERRDRILRHRRCRS